MSGRSCGSCVVCCVYPNLPELGKSALSPCPYLRPPKERRPDPVDAVGMPQLTRTDFQRLGDNNCGDYTIKPDCCDKYQCAWKRGAGSDKDRPDYAGVLIDDITSSGKVHNALFAKPLWLGAESEQAGQDAIIRISQTTGTPIIVLEFTERRALSVVGRGA